MQTIAFQSIPSQVFNYIDPAGNQWDIGIRLVSQQVAFSFTLNGATLITGITAVPNVPIIPYQYLENGNFLITTQNQQIVDYTQFGLTQTLYFLEPADLAALRQPAPALITAADFNPLGALPLRFAPQGYTVAP